MSYHLSATKLQTYARCPQAYYFRYERRLAGSAAFGSAALGTALHQTLAQVYRDWHYGEPIPPLSWLETCWQHHRDPLTPKQGEEGWHMLQSYWVKFIQQKGGMPKPLGIEGYLRSSLQRSNVEFTLTGRYDRLDWTAEGLTLIDYKSAQTVALIDANELQLQLGLYYVILAQIYRHSLRDLRLIYLRTGEEAIFPVLPDAEDRFLALIQALADQLRQEKRWSPCPGDHCDRCEYSRYCPAIQTDPEPIPVQSLSRPTLQLTLDFYQG